MIGFLNDGFRGPQGVPKHKIGQVGVFQRYCTKEQRFLLGPNPQGHAAVVFDRYSWHTPFRLYTFKQYDHEWHESTMASFASSSYLERTRTNKHGELK